MVDVLLDKYDIYYTNAAGAQKGLMLAHKRPGTKMWAREDAKALPGSFATGDISYANLSPEVQKVIAQRLMNGGLGASEHEVEDDADYYAMRYLRSENVDLRCRGKAYPGPKIVSLTLPTVTVAAVTNGDMELDDNWTGGAQSAVQKHGGTYSWKVNANDASYQDITWPGTHEYRSRVFEVTGWIYDPDVTPVSTIQIDDGITTYDTGVGTKDTWTKVTIRQKLSTYATRLRINQVAPLGGSDTYFDDIEITELPTADAVIGFIDFNGEQYGADGNILVKMNAGLTGYNYVHSFPATITDLCVFTISGVDYLYIALGDADELWYSGMLIEDCEDAWDELVDTDVTSTADTTDKVVGSASAKFVVADACAAGDILATEVISADLTSYTSISFYIKSSVVTAKGDLQLLLDDTAECAGPIKTLDIPILAADTWTFVTLNLGDASGLGAVISIGLKFTVDLGACTIRLDQVMTDFIEAASECAYHLAATTSTLYAIKEAGGNKLRKTTAVDTWSDVDYVGNALDKHNDLVNLGGTIWILKQNGPYYLDSTPAVQWPFPELETIRHDDAGKNSIVSRDKLYFRMGAQQEWEIDGSDLSEVTPANFAPDIAEYAYPCVARAADESWVFHIIKRGSTDLSILAGRWEYLAAATRWVWHDIRKIDLTDVAVAAVSSVEGRPYLYLGSTNSAQNVYKVYLPVTNDATADSDYRFYTAGSLWSPKYRTLLFVAQKLWQTLAARSINLSATKYITVYRSIDAGVTFTVLDGSTGKLITSPAQTLSYPSGIESSQMNLRFDFVSNSESTVPVLLDYNLTAASIDMDSVVRFLHTIRCADGMRLKKNVVAPDDYTAAAIRTFIDTIRDDVVTLGDRWGTEHTVNVRIAREYETIDEEKDTGPETHFDIEALKLA